MAGHREAIESRQQPGEARSGTPGCCGGLRPLETVTASTNHRCLCKRTDGHEGSGQCSSERLGREL